MITTFWLSPTGVALCRCATSCTLPSRCNLCLFTRWRSGWIWGWGWCFPLPGSVAPLYSVRHPVSLGWVARTELVNEQGSETFNLLPEKEIEIALDWRVLVLLQVVPNISLNMPGETVVTGYYRYTDIWFEWYASDCIKFRLHWSTLTRHQSLPDIDDRSPLKAILGLAPCLLWSLSH